MSESKFFLIECRMFKCHINKRQAAEYLGISRLTFDQRLKGLQPWTLTEMYDLMELLSIDPAEMSIYFPR